MFLLMRTKEAIELVFAVGKFGTEFLDDSLETCHSIV